MLNQQNEKNYYDILEVSINASQDEIKESYLRAKNAYSQDSLALYSLMSKEECENILKKLDEAYSIISDPNKRIAYDQARGIKKDLSNPLEATLNHKPMATRHSPAPNINAPPQNIAKIVATNKFNLDYKKSPEFEQEIEQTNEFSGELLKKIREYKNVDIIRMAEMTKVSKTYLSKIEDEEFDNLPALVYVRGFVYQYAKCLKLNPDLVATSYLYRVKKNKGKL